MKKAIVVFSLVIAAILLAGCTETSLLGESEKHGDSLKDSIVSLYCKARHTGESYDVLGYAEQRDDVDNEWYGFIICKQNNLNTGAWEMRVFSNAGNVTGANQTPELALEKSQQAQSEGKSYYTFGLPFHPLGELDKRQVEYRIYQTDGKPTAVEVFVVMRNADRTPKEPVALRAEWPSGGLPA